MEYNDNFQSSKNTVNKPTVIIHVIKTLFGDVGQYASMEEKHLNQTCSGKATCKNVLAMPSLIIALTLSSASLSIK